MKRPNAVVPDPPVRDPPKLFPFAGVLFLWSVALNYPWEMLLLPWPAMALAFGTVEKRAR